MSTATVVRKRPKEELPLGSAILRLIEAKTSLDATPPSQPNPRLETEIASLEYALNSFVLTVSMECDIEAASTLIEDAVSAEMPTSLELINKGAATDCCRVVDASSPRKVRATAPRRERRGRGKSR